MPENPSFVHKTFTNLFFKTYCNCGKLVLNCLSLMCDEAGGCDHSVGNFRGVCPINGRQQIRTQSVSFLCRLFLQAETVRRQGIRLRIREQGLKTRASGTAGMCIGTPECGNMITLKAARNPFPWRIGFRVFNSGWSRNTRMRVQNLLCRI